MADGRVVLSITATQKDADAVAKATVRRVTRKVLNRSAILCPVDTGRLRASGRMDFKDDKLGPVGTVTYPVRYAAIVHDGSKPHIIRAKRGKALKFEMGGKTVIVESVRHPGSRGRPFLRMAAQEVAAAEGFIFRRRGR
jgi:hypothetical protein